MVFMSVLTIQGIDSLLKYLPYFHNKNNRLYEILESGEKGVYLMDPYNYSDDVMSFLSILYKVNFIDHSFNTECVRARVNKYVKNPVLIDSVDLQILREILTIGIQNDRFCSGVIASMINDGIILGCLIRLETIRSRLKIGLLPVTDPNLNTQTIIMGTLPGDTSLDSGEYFADNRNDFWKLVGEGLNVDMVQLNYEDKKQVLYDHGIGLWDIYSAGERKGSSDNKIKNGLINDFLKLKTLAPRLENVLLMGKDMVSFEEEFEILGYKTHVLPSSSSANRGYPGRSEKWKTVLKDIHCKK